MSEESVELHLQERPLGAGEIQYYKEIPNQRGIEFLKRRVIYELESL